MVDWVTTHFESDLLLKLFLADIADFVNLEKISFIFPQSLAWAVKI